MISYRLYGDCIFLVVFSALGYKGENCCDFLIFLLFFFLHIKAILKTGLTLKGKSLLPRGINSFF